MICLRRGPCTAERLLLMQKIRGFVARFKVGQSRESSSRSTRGSRLEARSISSTIWKNLPYEYGIGRQRRAIARFKHMEMRRGREKSS